MSSEKTRGNSRQLEGAGKLSAPVAHDINNLLSGILGYCDLLLAESAAEHWRPHLEEISSAGKSIASLARMLMVFTRRGIPRPEILNPNDIIHEIEKFILYLVKPEIEFAAVQESALWPVRADAAQMKRALLTLAMDIRDRMPKGGKLVLETKNVVLAPDTAGNGPAEPGNYILIAGNATGSMGTSSYPSGRITLQNAEQFFQEAGSGLSDVFEAVQICGGEIFLDSVSDHETRILMYFPAMGPNSQA